MKQALRAVATVVCVLGSPFASAGAVVSLERVSVSSTGVQANSSNYHAVISADGRYVAFDSEATNLDPILPDGGGSGLGYPNHIYLRDRQVGTTQLISVTPGGTKLEWAIRIASHQFRRSLHRISVGSLEPRYRGHEQ